MSRDDLEKLDRDPLIARAALGPATQADFLAPLASMTLARLYAQQGHPQRAIDVLRQVIASDSTNTAAPTMLGELASQLDGAAGENVCVATAGDDGAVLVHWRCADDTARRASGADAAELVVRAVVITPTWDGPKVDVRDATVSSTAGEMTLLALGQFDLVRVAVGVMTEGDFAPLAHTS